MRRNATMCVMGVLAAGCLMAAGCVSRATTTDKHSWKLIVGAPFSIEVVSEAEQKRPGQPQVGETMAEFTLHPWLEALFGKWSAASVTDTPDRVEP